MEELVRLCNGQLICDIQFNHHQESYKVVDSMPFLKMRKLRANKVNLLAKIHGIQPKSF